MFFLPHPREVRPLSGGWRGEEMEKVICEWGVVKEIIFEDEKKVILIKSPAFTETARRLREYYEEQGYEVHELNTGVDYEYEEAERLLKQYCE